MRDREAFALANQQLHLTEFAPAFRAPLDTVRNQFRSFIGTHCRAFFDALPTMIMALNCHRQMVFANQATVSFLGHTDVEEVLGRRPGEALGCVNASAHSGGCGTSKYCRSCGALAAILSAIDGVVTSEDCKLLRRVTAEVEGLDLHVSAAPIAIEGERYIIFSVADITHETRRRNMERIFFHDVLNLAGGINGMTEVLLGMAPDNLKGEMSILRTATESLVDEVLAQRDISAAESNELKLCVRDIHSLEVLHRVQGFYAHSPVAHGRSIVVDPASADVDIIADARLVQRVLGNMLKNALEAEPSGGTARLSCREEGDEVVFSVHNHGVIPEAVQDNIFHRTFSTKGSGRGMGTYSMLMLSERYLNGSVGFRSNEAEGTVFFLRIPQKYAASQECSALLSA